MISINGLNNLPQDVITGSGSDTVQAEQSQDSSIFDDIITDRGITEIQDDEMNIESLGPGVDCGDDEMDIGPSVFDEFRDGEKYLIGTFIQDEDGNLVRIVNGKFVETISRDEDGHFVSTPAEGVYSDPSEFLGEDFEFPEA